MIHQCNYNTMNRDKPTYGGLATAEEMCLNIMWYYPRLPNFKYCTSTSLIGPYKFVEKHFPKLKPYAHRWYNPMTAIKPNWTDEMTSDLKRFYDENKVITDCTKGNISNINDWLNPDNLANKVTIKKPYVPPISRCDVMSSSQALHGGVLYILGTVAWALSSIPQ
ncbi:DBH-like monooxygenase protein 1 [Exaiptasia diaphana]|uniref:Copper type II ascorbate-dependent monooxygenase C-terminal domain-containing protein n=1 Tax=Exaiptasia diaphana TaxID=2652724 RepID=A0A913XPU8_EXADI|nr:DBH-like monooxygenase protein 1 [Exaiptasia diaphana]